MSKKSNPIILRLGIKNGWFSKYFEKKIQDLKILTFKDLEIQKFMHIFFKNNGLNIVSYKLFFKKHSLHLFIVYDIILLKFKNLIFNKLKTHRIKYLALNQIKFLTCETFLENFTNNFLMLSKKNINKKLRIIKLKNYKFLFKSTRIFYIKLKKIMFLHKNFAKINIYYRLFQNNLTYLFFRKSYITKFKQFLKKINLNKNLIEQNFLNLFIKKFLTNLSQFLNFKVNIFLTLKQINRSKIINLTNLNKTKLALTILNLKKFQKLNYFEVGINFIFNLYKNKNKIAYIISEFISGELIQNKNPQFFKLFFKFLVKNIKYFLLKNYNISGVEISLKGNLSRKPRASSKNFIIGKKISKIKLNTDLNYYESTCYSKKGTFGVKVWVIMKNGIKNIKFLKTKKGKLTKFSYKTNELKFGKIGLKALESGILNSQQIESTRQILIKKTNKKSKIWVRIFNFLPVTAKPIGVRMGKGKGKISHWVTRIGQGTIILEISGPNLQNLIISLLKAKLKLPVKTKICYK